MPAKKKEKRGLEELIKLVQQWGRDRKITVNGKPHAQLLKAFSEMGELSDAEQHGDLDGIVDAVGDTLVCLIMYCTIRGLTLQECLGWSYDIIKDRKGYLSSSGVFIKEQA